jgi:hypothetical protein
MKLITCNIDLINQLNLNTIYLMAFIDGTDLLTKPVMHTAGGNVVYERNGALYGVKVHIADDIMPLVVYGDNFGPTPLKEITGDDSPESILNIIESFGNILNLEEFNNDLARHVRGLIVDNHKSLLIPHTVEDFNRYKRK